MLADDIDHRFAISQFVVRANDNERSLLHDVWKEKIEWNFSNDGVVVQVGQLDGHAITVKFTWNKINDKLILFYSCVSSVRDDEQIEEWLKENCRPRYRKGLAHCTAADFDECITFCEES